MKKSFYCAVIISISIFFGSQAIAQQESIFTTGIGETIQAALQNAATNALTQAVGQFIDVETQMIRSSEIREGVLDIVSEITEDIRTTSNGSVREINVIDVRQENGLYTASVMVVVEVNDLQAYIAPILSSNGAISEGLFASLLTDFDNRLSRSEIFENQILLPIFSLSGVSYDLGSFLRLSGVHSSFEPIHPDSTFQNILNPGVMDGVGHAILASTLPSARYFSNSFFPNHDVSLRRFVEVVNRIEDSGVAALYAPIVISTSDSELNRLRTILTELSSDTARFSPEFRLRENILTYFRNSSSQTVEMSSSFIVCLAQTNYSECYLVSDLNMQSPNTPFLNYFGQDNSDGRNINFYPSVEVTAFEGEEVVLQDNVYIPQSIIRHNSASEIFNLNPLPPVIGYNERFSPYVILSSRYDRQPTILFVSSLTTSYIGLNFQFEDLRSISNVEVNVSLARDISPHINN